MRENSRTMAQKDVKKIINDGRNTAYGAVNSVMIRTNWAIGKRIVEKEQSGADRAEYGTRVIQLLSEELTNEYGKVSALVRFDYADRYFLLFHHKRFDRRVCQILLGPIMWSCYVLITRTHVIGICTKQLRSNGASAHLNATSVLNTISDFSNLNIKSR